MTVATIAALAVGFIIGWLVEFERQVAENRPNGCDSLCLVSADEFYDNALVGGVIGAAVLGGLVYLWARRSRARLS